MDVGTFASAFIGAVIGVMMERLWQYVASESLFQIHLSYFESLDRGKGITLAIENVGLDSVFEYTICLFHPDRGRLQVFNGDSKDLVFPQCPTQTNRFYCVIQPIDGENVMLKTWLYRVRDQKVDVPTFDGFILKLILRNSDRVLFADAALGNNIAKQMFEQVTGLRTSQSVEDVYYISRAPFWVRLTKWLRGRKRIRRILKTVRNVDSARPDK